ncbi:MAG: hypothetical protein WD926_00625 [Patescibacteria group bacterium]
MTVHSDGEGNVTHAGKRLHPDASYELDSECRYALRKGDPIGSGREELLVYVYDLKGVRVGISVDREGDYVICDDRAFPVGGPDHPFDRS